MSPFGPASTSDTLPTVAVAWVPVTDPMTAAAPGIIAVSFHATFAPDFASSADTMTACPSPTVSVPEVNASTGPVVYPFR